MRRYASFEVWSLFEGESRMVVEFETVKCKFCDSENVVKNGRRSGTQYFICKNCGRGFVGNKGLPGMRYPVDAVSGAILNYYTGSSLNDIRDHIIQNYGMYPSDSTIYRWITEFSKVAMQETFKHTPNVGDTWIADETMLTIRTRSGKRGKRWLFDIIDADTRFLLATHLSSTRTTKDARRLVELAAAKAGKVPKVIITDKLAGYIDGIELAFGADTKHIQSKPFTDTNSTNLIERFHGTLKDRTKVMRGMKQPLPEILDGWLIYYNYFRPHESLNDKTPAEAAGIKFPFRNWLDVVKSQSPVVERKEQEKEGFTFAPVKNYRRRMYRGKRRTTVNRFGNEPKLTVGIVSTRR